MSVSRFDLGIRCGYLVTMDSKRNKVERDMFVGVVENKLTAIETYSSELQDQSSKFIDAGSNIVLPGLINGHTHLSMSLFRGLADDLPFQKWLFDYIIPLESRLVNEDFVRLGARQGLLESLRRGVTTVCDMYYFSNAVADAVDQIGMRAVVAQAVLDLPTPDDPQKQGRAFELLDRLSEKYKNHSRIDVAVGPHAPYTCEDETIRRCRKWADAHGAVAVMHVSETAHEVAESVQRHGKTPVARLNELGLWNGPAIIAHGVHLSDPDLQIVKQRGVSVVTNPESNMKLGSGVCEVRKLRGLGIAVGIGTDGAASNNDLSIFREMDSTAKLQKLTHANNTALTAWDALSMATIDGARALHIADRVGSLEVGKRADFVSVSLRDPHMWPVYDVASLLVYAADGSEVETTVCDGKVLMHQNEFYTESLSDLRKSVDAMAGTIRKSAGL